MPACACFQGIACLVLQFVAGFRWALVCYGGIRLSNPSSSATARKTESRFSRTAVSQGRPSLRFLLPAQLTKFRTQRPASAPRARPGAVFIGTTASEATDSPRPSTSVSFQSPEAAQGSPSPALHTPPTGPETQHVSRRSDLLLCATSDMQGSHQVNHACAEGLSVHTSDKLPQRS